MRQGSRGGGGREQGERVEGRQGERVAGRLGVRRKRGENWRIISIIFFFSLPTVHNEIPGVIATVVTDEDRVS